MRPASGLISSRAAAVLALILAAPLPAAAGEQGPALEGLKDLAARPASAPRAFDGGPSGAHSAPSPEASQARRRPPLPERAEPRSAYSASREPATPAEERAASRGKVVGGIVGGLIGALSGGISGWAVAVSGGPAVLAVLLGLALTVGAVFIGMDVGKHVALDELRGE